MKEAGQRYVWTTKLVENVNRPNTLWLIRKRISAPDLSTGRPLASRFKCLPDAPPNTSSNFPPSSSSSSSSESSSSSCSLCCSCCSSATSDSSSSNSSGSSLSSCSPPSSAVSKRDPAGKAETWMCELVKGHHKVIIRRQMSDSSVPRTKTASQPEIGKHSSELQRRTKTC